MPIAYSVNYKKLNFLLISKFTSFLHIRTITIEFPSRWNFINKKSIFVYGKISKPEMIPNFLAQLLKNLNDRSWKFIGNA